MKSHEPCLVAYLSRVGLIRITCFCLYSGVFGFTWIISDLSGGDPEYLALSVDRKDVCSVLEF